MKFFAALPFIAGLVAAAPLDLAAAVAEVEVRDVELETRQTSTTSNELTLGLSSRCPQAILIFARGSTELGNMGSTVGPDLANSLERQVESLWVQGVGGPYDATLLGNNAIRGSPESSIAEGVRLFNLARSKCPNSAIVAGGYSQGAALIAAAVSDLNAATREAVNGVVLFGYTKNLQNRGRIPNYPADRTRVYCAIGDLVCQGTLIVVAPHLTYGDDARGPAASFLAGQI
ncbi:hypothetical protein S40285_04613 [Stachybotrys chlorohalonatus IBT 40285]|uniref:Cutinase n=1 Tax=Stachybotrys chlorohalonatus (strain IBT 40285) TaxID=1283841 RepID=A0A084QZS1_STAC4|nr:hypothetical protein S40285_04613 [Stachybotrys chlorohalonata IBT 40285]